MSTKLYDHYKFAGNLESLMLVLKKMRGQLHERMHGARVLGSSQRQRVQRLLPTARLLVQAQDRRGGRGLI
jgi:hypothetical protein